MTGPAAFTTRKPCLSLLSFGDALRGNSGACSARRMSSLIAAPRARPLAVAYAAAALYASLSMLIFARVLIFLVCTDERYMCKIYCPVHGGHFWPRYKRRSKNRPQNATEAVFCGGADGPRSRLSGRRAKGNTSTPRNTSRGRAYGHSDARFPRLLGRIEVRRPFRGLLAKRRPLRPRPRSNWPLLVVVPDSIIANRTLIM